MARPPMTAAAPPTAVRPTASPWFRSAAFDLPLILAVPLFTWPLVMAAQDAWGAALVGELILLTATGHYFATFVRTYGDQELFVRFRLRFVLAPLLLVPFCVLLLATGRGSGLLLVTSLWAFWHWLAQAFGFARIYDIKAGSYRPLTALLDKALVITGFVGAVTLNDGPVVTFGKLFLDAGIPLPSPATLGTLQQMVLGAMILVGAAYVANLLVTVLRRQPWSWQKQLMHVTTIGYYWFALAWLPNVLVAYVLYELFHDVQYYAITWLTCRGRVRRPNVTPWLRSLFRPGPSGVLLFLLAMTAFGAFDLFGRRLSEQSLLRDLSVGLFLAAALLHYYYDGFIWKARESALGQDLGIQGGLRDAMVPALRHSARWSLFAAPILLLLWLGRPVTDPLVRAQALVALAPGDFVTQGDLAFQLGRGGDLEGALRHHAAAVAANPDYALTRANHGAALELHGDLDQARQEYEAALRCHDGQGAHRLAHVNLGILLLLRGERARADEHFQAGARLGGEPPLHRLLALAQAIPPTAGDRRRAYLGAALALEPAHVGAHLELGGLLLQRRDYTTADRHFAAVLQVAPDVVDALVGRAACQAGLGQREVARALVQQALQRQPGHPQALALQQHLQSR